MQKAVQRYPCPATPLRATKHDGMEVVKGAVCRKAQVKHLYSGILNNDRFSCKPLRSSSRFQSWVSNVETPSNVVGARESSAEIRAPRDEYFFVTSDRGFLPVTDPSGSLFFASSLQNLPQFQAWEDILNNLSKVLVAYDGEKVRNKIEKLPRFHHEEVLRNGERGDIWRAMLVLSFIAHAYVWCGKTAAQRLPDNISESWCTVAEELGVPPVGSYATYNLMNWRRLDESLPVAIGNIVPCYDFYGGLDEDWFILVHIDIESTAAPALEAILKAQAAALVGDVGKVKQSLTCMKQTLQLMQKTLLRMGEKCDPFIFYHRVRRFLSGWRANPHLPDGLLYGNVLGSFYGSTGAQSAIVPAFDGALGIVHPEGPLFDYLQTMRLHMPSSHRQYLQGIEAGPSIRRFVILNRSELGEAYNECILELFKFRSIHKGYAKGYVKEPSKGEDGKGTGGTDFMPYLPKNATTTRAHLINSINGST